MSVKLVQEVKMSSQELRKQYATTLNKLIEKNNKVLALEADLMGAIATAPVLAEHPDNFINCGIMEANMAGMSAGLNVRGFIPFMHTFGPFATRRCYDQLYLSVGYAGLSTKVIGSDAGVTAQHNGGTHMPFEDIALMRAIPGATVLEMSDHVMFDNILTQIADKPGLDYVRIVRKTMYQLYEEGSTFEIGKGIVLREGTDVTLVASGIMIKEALDARDILAEEGISAAVIDMWTIKPIDTTLLEEYQAKTKLIVTAENHNVIGGLGSAVTETLAPKGAKVVRVGVQDRFGQVGTQDFLQEEYNLKAADIVKAVKENL